MSRTRSQSSVPVIGYNNRFSSGILTSSTAYSRVPYYQQVIDEVVPNFWRRSRSGEVFFNGFSKLLINRAFQGEYSNVAFDNSSGAYWSNGAIFQALYGPDLGYMPDTLGINTSDLVASAKIETLGNVNSTDLNFPVFAAEWSKTKQLHRDLGNSIWQTFRSSINPRDSNLTTTKKLSSVWLGARYGLMPAISDLQSALKVLHRTYSPRYTARGRASDARTVTTNIVISDTPCDWYLKHTDRFTFEVRAGSLYESNELARFAANLGLTRPLSVAYELASYSFVLDWFYDVGGWLDAIQPQPGVRTLGSWVRTDSHRVKTLEVVGHSPISPAWNASWNGAALFEHRYIERSRWDGATPSAPAFGSGFSTIRSTDFAAMLLQKLRLRRT